MNADECCCEKHGLYTGTLPRLPHSRKEASMTPPKRLGGCLCGIPESCCVCGATTIPESPVTYAPNPYDEEIHGDDTPVWMCDICRDESALDI